MGSAAGCPLRGETSPILHHQCPGTLLRMRQLSLLLRRQQQRAHERDRGWTPVGVARAMTPWTIDRMKGLRWTRAAAKTTRPCHRKSQGHHSRVETASWCIQLLQLLRRQCRFQKNARVHVPHACDQHRRQHRCGA